jgi:hypothetical protein
MHLVSYIYRDEHPSGQLNCIVGIGILHTPPVGVTDGNGIVAIGVIVGLGTKEVGDGVGVVHSPPSVNTICFVQVVSVLVHERVTSYVPAWSYVKVFSTKRGAVAVSFNEACPRAPKSREPSDQSDRTAIVFVLSEVAEKSHLSAVEQPSSIVVVSCCAPPGQLVGVGSAGGVTDGVMRGVVGVGSLIVGVAVGNPTGIQHMPRT